MGVGPHSSQVRGMFNLLMLNNYGYVEIVISITSLEEKDF